MKKTLVALMAMAGLASADVTLPTPVWEQHNISLTTVQTIDLSNLNLNTTEGYTLLMVIEDLTPTATQSMVRLTTTGTSWNQSTGTIGFNSPAHCGISVFNAANGSSQIGIVDKAENAGDAVSFQKYVSGSPLDFGGPFDTTLFMTVQDGQSTLFESILDSPTHAVTQTTSLATGQSMVTGDVTNLVIGNWNLNGAALSSGTAYMALYRGVLTQDQMNAITPEPATATLSLLALAGLAARRRRH